MSCERCGSFAINHAAHGRDGSEPSLCDVCYWRQRTEQCTASNAAKDAEIASFRDTLRQWQYAENNNDRDELANARTNRDEALAQVAEAGK